MLVHFFKYQGTGNDFIIIDNRSLFFPKNTTTIAHLCDRKFGIGADGLMLLEPAENYIFRMVYYNADGNESSMCGNGGRCIAKFAVDLGIIEGESATFIAIDGEHDFIATRDSIKLKMIDVWEIKPYQNDFILNTGSPHYVRFVKSNNDNSFIEEAKKIRYNNDFKNEGININFVVITNHNNMIRTYERGVENETLSCGTGNVAAALCIAEQQLITSGKICLETMGGQLSVYFTKKENYYTDIFLEGAATFVYKGEIHV